MSKSITEMIKEIKKEEKRYICADCKKNVNSLYFIKEKTFCEETNKIIKIKKWVCFNCNKKYPESNKIFNRE